MSISYNSIMAEEKFVPRSLIIGDLFYNQNSYEVPPYQRDFSWKKSPQIETFWDDIKEIKKDELYFFGSVIFQIQKNEKNKIIIIDGQQRLITVTILLAVIRDKFNSNEIDDKGDGALTQAYIIKPRTRVLKIKKLKLNLRNEYFFCRCIQAAPYEDINHMDFNEYEKSFGKLKGTNRLIKEAYNFFEEKINEDLSNKRTKEEKIDYLNDLSEKIRENLSAISITVDNLEDAYMIFETINERGLELSVSDLFKNYFISKSKDKEEMVTIWENIFNMLDNNLRTFLKHYWHTKQGVTQERKLFRELKTYVEKRSNKVNIDVLTKELEKEAIIYAVLQDPDSDYWNDEEMVELLRDFRVLNLKQALPILVVAKLTFDNDGFKKFLKLIINFGFRYFTICNFSPSLMERRYSEISIKIRNKEIKNELEALEEMEKRIERYPNDETFKEFFLKKEFQKETRIVKYILRKIEQNKFSMIDKKKENTEPIDYSKLTLEHILPQNMDDEWKNYFKNETIPLKEMRGYIYRLGNLTLLDKFKNEFSKNEFITKKCEKAYNISKLKINANLQNLNEWDKTSIGKRQEDYFNEAKEIWKITF